MIIQKFLQWSQTASASERARAAGLLAGAYLYSNMSADERKSAEAAMVFVLDDPSPKVRLALADALAGSAAAPAAVISALTRDQVDVASCVIARSPLIGEGELVDLVADGRIAVQRVVAARTNLPVAVCAAIAEVGDVSAVADLLDNAGARIAGISLRRIAQRFGDVAEIRTQLLERTTLPCDVRHGLIQRVSDALSGFSLVSAAVGADRVQRITSEACLSATLKLAGNAAAEEMPALVEHLRIAGKLTPAFLIHSLCAGNVDFFAAAIVSLSGYGAGRVRGVLVDGRNYAIRALYRAAGIAEAVIDIFVDATLMWREVLGSRRTATDMSVPQRLVSRHKARGRDDRGVAELLRLIEKMDLAMRRQQAREFAETISKKAA